MEDTPYSVGLASKEMEFLKWIKALPWYQDYVARHGEEPDLDTKDYDYRKAWESGLAPTINKSDNMYHWPSSTESGEMLKGTNHPTLWKEYFMRAIGKDPDDVQGLPRLKDLFQ